MRLYALLAGLAVHVARIARIDALRAPARAARGQPRRAGRAVAATCAPDAGAAAGADAGAAAAADAGAATPALSDAWATRVAAIAEVAGTPRAIARLRRGVDESGDGDAPEAAYLACFSYALDEFQVDALRSLRAGRNALVSAPTGAGKTAVGELAIALALAGGRRVFYTTPLKALSNQKFRDFCQVFGAFNVGLATGDGFVRRDAAVVVMTTEVLRNMLYGDRGAECLADAYAVVYDESAPGARRGGLPRRSLDSSARTDRGAPRGASALQRPRRESAGERCLSEAEPATRAGNLCEPRGHRFPGPGSTT